MSEYLSKKAVLEHIRREIGITERQQDAVMTRHMKEFHGGAIRALQNLEHAIQSGAFDADNTEVQRLRAALEKITKIFDDPNLHELTACQEMNKVAREALSTTTEPKQDKTCVICGTREGKYLSTANRWFCEPCTDALPPVNANAAKVERIECPCCGCEISIKP